MATYFERGNINDNITTAEKRAALEQSLKRTGKTMGRITVSIGAAEYSHGEEPDTFIARADRGLYKAKRSGRNCVVIEIGEPVTT